MTHPVRRHARVAGSRTAYVAETQMLAVLRAQDLQAPDLFSSRDEDAAEYAAILRDFERAHDELAEGDQPY